MKTQHTKPKVTILFGIQSMVHHQISFLSHNSKQERLVRNQCFQVFFSTLIFQNFTHPQTVFRQDQTLLDQGCPNFDENFFGASVHEKIEI